MKDCLSVVFDPLENNSLILGQKICNISWQQVIDTIRSGIKGGVGGGGNVRESNNFNITRVRMLNIVCQRQLYAV